MPHFIGESTDLTSTLSNTCALWNPQRHDSNPGSGGRDHQHDRHQAKGYWKKCQRKYNFSASSATDWGEGGGR